MTGFKLRFLKSSLPGESGQKQKTQLEVCNPGSYFPCLLKERNEALLKFRECFALDTVMCVTPSLNRPFAKKIPTIETQKSSEANQQRRVPVIPEPRYTALTDLQGTTSQIPRLRCSEEAKKLRSLLAVKQTQQRGVGVGLFDQFRAQKTKPNIAASELYKL